MTTKPDRPPEPSDSEYVWHLGWECGYDSDAAFWSGEGWRAYKGGCDLDASSLSGRTYAELLDEIEAEEDC